MFGTVICLMIGVFFGVGIGRSFESGKIKEQLVIVDQSDKVLDGRWDDDKDYVYRLK